MLVKLTQGRHNECEDSKQNRFLREAFLYKAFLLVKILGLNFFWRKNIGKNALINCW
jgi:hypothetical protein